MGPVYDGIGHLLLSPEDLVPVLALALYAGLRGAVAGRRTMFLLPLAWFVGGLAGSAVNAVTSFPVPAVSFLILGGLVAADLCMPTAAVTVLAIVARPCPWIPERSRSAGGGRNDRVDRDHDRTFCPGDINFGPCRLAGEAVVAHCGACGRQLGRRYGVADVGLGDEVRGGLARAAWT